MRWIWTPGCIRNRSGGLLFSIKFIEDGWQIMSQSPAPTRVSGGPPWWLWGILILATVSVVAGIIVSSTPEDPQTVVEDLKANWNRVDREVAKQKLEILGQHGGYEDDINYLEGMLAYREKRDPRALRLMAKIPDSSDLKAEALKIMGDIHRRTGNFDESMKNYEKSVAAAPKAGGIVRVALAAMYFQIGAEVLAEETLDEAIKLEPDLSEALKTRALIKVGQKRYEEAKEDFAKILVSPGDFSSVTPDILSGYVISIMETDDQKAIEDLSDNHLALLEEPYQRMALFIAAGRFDEVDEEIELAGGVTSLTAPARKMELLMAVEKEQWAKAEKLVMPIVEQMPRDRELFEIAARVYKAADKHEMLAAAEENVKQLLEIEDKIYAGIKAAGGNIDNAEPRIEVARLYQELGNYRLSRRWYAIAAKLDERYEEEAGKALAGITFPRVPIAPFPEMSKDKEEKTQDDANAQVKSEPKEGDEESKGDPVIEEAASDDAAAPEPDAAVEKGSAKDDTPADGTQVDEVASETPAGE